MKLDCKDCSGDGQIGEQICCGRIDSYYGCCGDPVINFNPCAKCRSTGSESIVKVLDTTLYKELNGDKNDEK